MKKSILEMPKCLDRECVNGIVMRKVNDEVVQKICAKCEKMEKDLEASEDYIVYYENGRACGYEILDDTTSTRNSLHEFEAELIKNSPEYK